MFRNRISGAVTQLHLTGPQWLSDWSKVMGAKKDKAKGKWEETKGKSKQAWGDITDDPDKVDEGTLEETKGKARQKLGDAKEWVKEKTDN
jgi:uncharacterized protein YjbJ (UPF0337 family)